MGGSICRSVQKMFLNDFDLDLGFLRGTPLMAMGGLRGEGAQT